MFPKSVRVFEKFKYFIFFEIENNERGTYAECSDTEKFEIWSISGEIVIEYHLVNYRCYRSVRSVDDGAGVSQKNRGLSYRKGKIFYDGEKRRSEKCKCDKTVIVHFSGEMTYHKPLAKKKCSRDHSYSDLF